MNATVLTSCSLRRFALQSFAASVATALLWVAAPLPCPQQLQPGPPRARRWVHPPHHGNLPGARPAGAPVGAGPVPFRPGVSHTK